MALLAAACATAAFVVTRLGDVHVVLRSSQPRVAVREAVDAVENGQYVRALPRMARAGWMALDSSLRWRIADGYVKQANEQFEAGQVEEGFLSCRAATQALGRYDGGAEIDAECWNTHVFERRQAQ